MCKDTSSDYEKLDKIIQQKTDENEALKKLISALEKKPIVPKSGNKSTHQEKNN